MNNKNDSQKWVVEIECSVGFIQFAKVDGEVVWRLRSRKRRTLKK